MGVPFHSVVEHVGGKVLAAFSYFWFRVEFRDRISFPISVLTRKQQSVLTIRDACFAMTLITLRDLDDCLGSRKKKHPEDLRVAEWGFRAGCFLGDAEREDINAWIVHSSGIALKTPEPKFDINELMVKGVSQGLGFFRWVEQSHGKQRASAVAMFYRNRVEATLAYVRNYKAK